MATKAKTKTKATTKATGTTKKKGPATAGPKTRARQAEYIVLSCMDYRHMDDVVHAVESIVGGADRYDHLVLPGASLGAQLEGKLHWTQTFLDHLEIALALHSDVHTLLIIEHEDCGAYKTFLELDHDRDADLHRGYATALGELVHESYGLNVVYRIMRMKGSDENTWHPEVLAPDLE